MSAGGSVPPAALIEMAAAGSRRRIPVISLVRETYDGQPIGWILCMGNLRDDEDRVAVFARPGDLTADFRCYLNGETATGEEITGWIDGKTAAPVDEAIFTLFELALRNSWQVNLGRDDNSFHERPVPDLLRLNADAPDYQHGYSRPTESVFASRHEGAEDFALLGRSNHTGSYYPIRIDLEEAAALLGSTAPMSVDTLVYDEEAEDFLSSAGEEGHNA